MQVIFIIFIAISLSYTQVAMACGADINNSGTVNAQDFAISCASTLYNQAVQKVKKDKSAIESIYVSSLNDVIDVHSERVAAILNQLPKSVLMLLLVSLTFAMVSFGYVEELKKRKSGFWLSVLSVLFAVVITLVIDIDITALLRC